MGRLFHKHIDDDELNALVPWPSGRGEARRALPPDTLHEISWHLNSCLECSDKLSNCRRFVSQLSGMAVTEPVPPGPDCPSEHDVDWHEVAGGFWPELKARQLIMHAALCGHCGPRLRAATVVDDDATPEEETLLAELSVPARPGPDSPPARTQHDWRFMRWAVPAFALVVIVGVLSAIPSASPKSLSGSQFAEFAVNTHKQHAQGRLALQVNPDSQQALNDWLKAKSQFSLVLPASPIAAADHQPYHLEGARIVEVNGKTAAFIAYQVQMPRFQNAGLQPAAASLMVVPDSVAVASGGVELDFTRVSFHYATVEGYKVVTWSVHGLTYALVSQEGNRTQRSCMVCHSAMGDRDLSQTPSPLQGDGNSVEPLLQ